MPSAGNLGTVHSKPLRSLQTEVSAETVAIHQKTYRLDAWYHENYLVQNTQTYTYSTFKVVSTGAPLI